jgi:hypothetical protein
MSCSVGITEVPRIRDSGEGPITDLFSFVQQTFKWFQCTQHTAIQEDTVLKKKKSCHIWLGRTET